MTDPGSSVCPHYDQIDVSIIRLSHDIDIWQPALNTYLGMQVCRPMMANKLFEAGPSVTLPSGISGERHRHIHVRGGHPGHVKNIKRCVILLGKGGGKKKCCN